MITAAGLGMAYGASELLLLLKKRAGGAAESRDRGTLAGVWLAAIASIGGSILVASTVSAGRYAVTGWVARLALALFLGGLALRWWSILTLGRFFTVDVALHADHQLVRRGPYRALRHPSYTGALAAFVGVGLVYGSVPGLLVLCVPITLALLWRIRVEERALAERFGAAWERHCERTWRLVPFLW